MSLRLVAGGALASVALIAAGCGSSSSAPSPAQPPSDQSRFLASAAAKSTGTPSMKTEVTVTMLSSKLPGGRLDMTATGALDNTNHRMDMQLDMSKFVSALGAGALGNPGDWVGEEVGDFGGGRAVLYMRLPVLTKQLPGGKPWIKIDLAQVGKQAGIDVSQLTQFANDPTQMVDWLRAASGDVTTVGTETIDGEETTHYKATIDLDKYPDLVPADQRDLVRRAVEQVKKSAHVSSFPIHVWVGKDGLVRQVRSVLTETIQGQTMNVVTSERFYDFGAPVDIALPRDDQAFDISNFGTGG